MKDGESGPGIGGIIYLGQHLVASSCCLRPYSYFASTHRIMGRKGVMAWRSGIVRRLRRGGGQVPGKWLSPLLGAASLSLLHPEQIQDKIKIDTPMEIPYKEILSTLITETGRRMYCFRRFRFLAEIQVQGTHQRHRRSQMNQSHLRLDIRD
jgi:hypothetical protein